MNVLVAILIACATAGAAAFVAELMARSWLRRRGRPYTWAPFTRTRMMLDRETLPTLEPVVEHRINADGERADPVPEERPLFRVLVVGGSAAECWFIDQESAWPAVVQKVLREPQNLARLGAKAAHVGNIARSLVAARHVDTVLEQILPHYEHLDAIVFMVGASDIVHWLEKDTPAVIDDDLPTTTVFAKHPEGPFGWTPRTLALRRIASTWYHRAFLPYEVRERAGKRLGDARRMRQRAREVLDEVPDPAPMLEGFEHWFHRLLLRAKAKAKHVVVVHQPWLERDFTPEEEKLMWSFATGRPYAEEVTRYYSHAVGWELHRLIDRRVTSVARRAGVVQVELMSQIPADFDHYYDEHHHTPRACALIGRIVANAILAAADKDKADARPAGDDAVRGPTPTVKKPVADRAERD